MEQVKKWAKIGVKEWKAILAALSTFTIFPVPSFGWEEDTFRRAGKWLPLVGALVGACWAGLYVGLGHFGTHPALGGALLAAAMPVLTGFVHLDGLLDTADGLLSWREREERLRILKDPHCGAFGVIALGLVLLVSLGGCVALLERGGSWVVLAAVPVASRALAVVMLRFCPKLSSSRLSAGMAGTGWGEAALALVWLALAGAALLWALGTRGAVVFSVGTVAFGALLASCRRAFGGTNGDMAGACITVFELAALVAAAF